MGAVSSELHMDLSRYYELQHPLALAPPPAAGPTPLHLATPPGTTPLHLAPPPLDHFLDGAPPQTAAVSDQHLEEVYKERSEVTQRGRSLVMDCCNIIRARR